MRSATGRRKPSHRSKTIRIPALVSRIVLSGEVRLLKPDPRIFHLFFKTHGIDPADAVYIDDLRANVEAATALGMHGIVFADPASLREELVKLGCWMRPMHASSTPQPGWGIWSAPALSTNAGSKQRRPDVFECEAKFQIVFPFARHGRTA